MTPNIVIFLAFVCISLCTICFIFNDSKARPLLLLVIIGCGFLIVSQQSPSSKNQIKMNSATYGLSIEHKNK